MITREQVIEMAKECGIKGFRFAPDEYSVESAERFAAACYRMGVEAGDPTYAGCTNAMAQSGWDTAVERGVENIDIYDVKAIYIACVSEIPENNP